MTTVLTEAFFLDSDLGKRFCVYHNMVEEAKAHRAILLVPPFAEELNKSRHMLNALAQELAARGFAVLLIDLQGCGDSEGEFRDSSWENWLGDLAVAYRYLRQRTLLPVSILAVRLGALLALDFLKHGNYPIDQLILWQPVVNGRQFLNQFLRLRLASDMLEGKNKLANGTQAIRNALLAGEVIEIAGYELPPKLALAIEAQKISDYLPLEYPIDWLELQTDAYAEIAPTKKQIIDSWCRQKVTVNIRQITGEEFWASQELAKNPKLLACTVQAFIRGNG